MKFKAILVRILAISTIFSCGIMEVNRYSSVALKRIRAGCHRRPWLPPNLFMNIKDLGILKPLRGRGSKLSYIRELPYFSNDPDFDIDLDDWHQASYRQNVNTGNLLTICCDEFEEYKVPVVVGNQKQDLFKRNSVNYRNLKTLEKVPLLQKSTICVINCCSVRNKAKCMTILKKIS